MSFSINVKLFAIHERREGKGWGEIKKNIKEKFNVNPPTVRALQMWEKETDRGVLEQAIKERAKKEAENIKTQTLAKVAEELLPRLWQARDAGEDIEYEGWRWFFSIVENTLGSVKFNRFIKKYQDERKGKPDIPPVSETSSSRSSYP